VPLLRLWLSQSGSDGSPQAGANPRDVSAPGFRLEEQGKWWWPEKLSVCLTAAWCLKRDSECKLFPRNLV